MQLIEVQLRNWRSYRNATFSFPELNGSPEANKKRVILIGAQNGVGKTSLLIALYLGLFGREAMHLIEGIRVSSTKDDQSLTYRNLLERTIHRPPSVGMIHTPWSACGFIRPAAPKYQFAANGDSAEAAKFVISALPMAKRS